MRLSRSLKNSLLLWSCSKKAKDPLCENVYYVAGGGRKTCEYVQRRVLVIILFINERLISNLLVVGGLYSVTALRENDNERATVYTKHGLTLRYNHE